MNKIRIAMAQINPTVGDFNSNLKKIIEFVKKATNHQVQLIVFPELVLCGYPPEDLVFNYDFQNANKKFLNLLAKNTKKLKIVVIVGFVNSKKNQSYNSCGVIFNGRVLDVYDKHFLPNYGVFDEKRYFKEGDKPLIIDINNCKFGLTICEDIWYKDGPAKEESDGGAEWIINLSASPYFIGKFNLRLNTILNKISEIKCGIIYCNIVGGQDEIVFDGRSFIIDKYKKIICAGKIFEEDLIIADLDFKHKKPKRKIKKITITSQLPITNKINYQKLQNLTFENELYYALTLGLKDYFQKNGFKKAVVGLSGGIDSSLVAAIACDALGNDSVIGITMPSRFSSLETRLDAEVLAKNLGIKFYIIPIEPIFKVFLKSLSKIFKDLPYDVTEENLQARIRGNLLMAISNKFGALVLTTGNKSEIATGYCTLYGDTAGGFAVIKDVPKTVVYKLARFFNKKHNREIIPETVFKRAPTAELRKNQTDQEKLPPYDVLDLFLKLYIEKNWHYKKLLKKFGDAIVNKTLKMIQISEYKRRQAPPGVKLTYRAFGKDWRMPITNKFS